jgi:holliday junction DNA helicase RuvA
MVNFPAWREFAMTNPEIARKLREHAAELAHAGHNLYRVRAFRQAAFAVLGLPREAVELGTEGLRTVPGIGDSLADTIAEYAATGDWHPRTPARSLANAC